MTLFFSGCHWTAALAALLVAAALLAAPGALAQQLVVDDAGVTDPGACQLETWISATAGWILPACTPLGRAEVTLGLGVSEEAQGDVLLQDLEYVAQVKLGLLPAGPGALGAALVVGAGFGPFAQATGERIEGAYTYVPLSYLMPDERLALHLNGGWSFDRLDGVHRALYGARADVMLAAPLTALSEVFGEGEDLGFQVGFRLAVLPERFHVEGTYGGALRGEAPAIGFAVGLAWTPPPFFRPLRL
jgi:hypothetical protein